MTEVTIIPSKLGNGYVATTPDGQHSAALLVDPHGSWEWEDDGYYDYGFATRDLAVRSWLNHLAEVQP